MQSTTSKLSIACVEEKEKELVQKMRDSYNGPSVVMNHYFEYQALNKERFVGDFQNGFIVDFEHAYTLLAQFVLGLQHLDKEDWPGHRIPQYLLLKHNLGSLVSGYDRLMNGLYSDAIILLRPVYEAVLRILFCSYFPEDAMSAIVSKPEPGQVCFNATNFTRDHLKVDWESIYRLSSGFTHSNQSQAVLEITELFRQDIKNFVSFEFSRERHQELESVPMNLIYFITWCMLRFMPLLFVEAKTVSLGEKALGKLRVAEEAFGVMVRNMPNKMAQTFDDVGRIAVVLREKEGITQNRDRAVNSLAGSTETEERS